MAIHNAIIAFSIVAGGISAVGTIWQFLIGNTPKMKAILGRFAIVIASICAIGYVLLTPVKSASHATPQSAAVHFQKAEIYFQEHNRPLAIKEAKQTLFLEPTHKEAHKLLGACYGIDQNMEGAAEEYKEAAAIDPDDTEAELGLAVALQSEGSRQEAKEAYRYVVRHPQSTATQRQAALAQLKVLGR